MEKLIVDSTQKIKQGRKEIEWKREILFATGKTSESERYRIYLFFKIKSADDMQGLKQPEYYRTCSFPGFSGMMFPGEWSSATTCKDKRVF